MALHFNIIFPDMIQKVFSKGLLTNHPLIYTHSIRHNSEFGHSRIALIWHNLS